MPSEETYTSDHNPSRGLPPVTPPSGKFLAKLFLVPLLIAAGIIAIAAGIIWLGGLGGPRTPAQFIEKLDKSNADVRWRAAADLAQVLLRDDQLASNPGFALDLAERLRKAMDSAAPTERALNDRLAKHPHLVERLSRLVQNQTDHERDRSDPEWKALETDWKKLEPDLNYILYLSSCLGNFMLPTGAPLLSELAMQEEGEVNIVETLRRRRAVWALANLGANLDRFDRLPSDRQEAIREQLEQEAAGGEPRGTWAWATRENLQGRQAGQPRTMGVAVALVQCSEFGFARQYRRDPFLRELAGYAMGFWRGSPDEDQMMDEALVALTQDDGQGSEALARLFINHEEQQRDSLPVTDDPGVRVRYNAVAALARRGSERTRLDMLEDMLDEQLQMKMHRLRRQDGTEVPDQATAIVTVVTALKAVAALHEQRPELVASRPSLSAAIERLKESGNPAVRTEAERTRLTLSPNP
jgi:hypothetical protein